MPRNFVVAITGASGVPTPCDSWTFCWPPAATSLAHQPGRPDRAEAGTRPGRRSRSISARRCSCSTAGSSGGSEAATAAERRRHLQRCRARLGRWGAAGPASFASPLPRFFGPDRQRFVATDGMVVCPCSGGTLSAIVHGTGTNLIHRAAAVHLKERRKLILVPRETPLSLVQLETCGRRRSGRGDPAGHARLLPRRRAIRDLIDFVVARICDQLGSRQHLDPPLGKLDEPTMPCSRPPAGDDPLQPHAVCPAVRAVGGGDGLVGHLRASRPAFRWQDLPGILVAWSSPAARRWPSIGWPTGARRAEPAHPDAPSAGRLAEPASVAAFTVALLAGFRGRHAPLPAPNPLPMSCLAAGAGLPVRLQLCEAIYAPVAFLAGGGLDAGAPGGLGGDPRELAWPPYAGVAVVLFGWPAST